jgi:hypothetical protein
VKTRGVDPGHPAATINIRALSFRPSPTTLFVILAWLRAEQRFHEDCLLIPSEEFRDICYPSEANGQLKFEWHPDQTRQTRLHRYRTSEAALLSQVANRLQG